MTKRGRPSGSQPTQAAGEKQLRLEIDEAVDDIIPVALAKKFRERLADAGPSTAPEQGEQKKPRGRKAEHLYCRRTPSEFLNC